MKVTLKNTSLSLNEVLTNSAELGIIRQLDYFDHDIANVDNLDRYTVVEPSDFVYNPRISTSAPVGPINRNRLSQPGVMSPLYTVFRLIIQLNHLFLEQYFKTTKWHSYMELTGNSGARSDRFSISDQDLFNMPVLIPSLLEQERVALILEEVNVVITLHQRSDKVPEGDYLRCDPVPMVHFSAYLVRGLLLP